MDAERILRSLLNFLNHGSVKLEIPIRCVSCILFLSINFNRGGVEKLFSSLLNIKKLLISPGRGEINAGSVGSVSWRLNIGNVIGYRHFRTRIGCVEVSQCGHDQGKGEDKDLGDVFYVFFHIGVLVGIPDVVCGIGC